MFNFLNTAASMVQSSSQPTHEKVNVLSLGGKDVIAGQVQEVAGSTILPLEVVMVIIASLLVSGFLLLLRESRIEHKNAPNKRI